MTTSAPIARASDTGTGFTSAPSTRMPSSVTTGVNNPGIASDARTAFNVEPLRSHTSAPFSTEVATAANGILSSSMGRSSKPRPTNDMKRWPFSRPPPNPKSANESTSPRRMPAVPVQKRSNSPLAYAAPTSAPTDVPQTMSGRTPARSSARTTPTCAQPRAAPLPKTRPSRGSRRLRTKAGSWIRLATRQQPLKRLRTIRVVQVACRGRSRGDIRRPTESALHLEQRAAEETLDAVEIDDQRVALAVLVLPLLERMGTLVDALARRFAPIDASFASKNHEIATVRPKVAVDQGHRRILFHAVENRAVGHAHPNGERRVAIRLSAAAKRELRCTVLDVRDHDRLPALERRVHGFFHVLGQLQLGQNGRRAHGMAPRQRRLGILAHPKPLARF